MHFLRNFQKLENCKPRPNPVIVRTFSTTYSCTANAMANPATFADGDIIYKHDESKKEYSLVKILKVEPATACLHVTLYSAVKKLPNKDELGSLQPLCMHAPISTTGFPDYKVLTNTTITANDLTGYYEYLRQTGQTNNLVALAQEAYKQGNALAAQKKHLLAIDAYAKAFGAIPQFFEAIDNKAFSHMDLGQWEEAIAGFTESLKVKADSTLAEFSIGECYFKMGQIDKAIAQFEKVLTIDPNDKNAPIWLAKAKAKK